jgi:SnoaL-like domain
MHRMTNIVATGSETGATARTYVDSVLMPLEPEGDVHQALGFYDDELVSTNTGWKIAQRTFTMVRYARNTRYTTAHTPAGSRPSRTASPSSARHGPANRSNTRDERSTSPLRPRTLADPAIMLGGASIGAAQRAAPIADGFLPVDNSLCAAYVQACADLGKQPGPTGGPKGPMFVHVSDDPDRAWAHIAPHALHETNSYGQWLSAAGGHGPYSQASDADALRATGNYAVLTPDGCIASPSKTGR